VLRLLYIEPKSMPTAEPVIDALTMKMVGALRKATRPNYFYCGFHTCTTRSGQRIRMN
jgi:hypothetical protein